MGTQEQLRVSCHGTMSALECSIVLFMRNKNFGQQIVDPKKFWSKIIFVQKVFRAKKFIGPKSLQEEVKNCKRVNRRGSK